jgi:hypothetical protein
MKKIIYILVSLLAFVCGIFFFYIRPLYITVSLNEINKDVSLSMLRTELREDSGVIS